MSMYDTTQTIQHSETYYRVREIVRVIFWSTLFLAPIWALLVLVA